MSLPEPQFVFPNPDKLRSDVKQVPRLSHDQLRTLPDMMQRLQLGTVQPEVIGGDEYESDGALVVAALRGKPVPRLPYISLGRIKPSLYEEILNRAVVTPIIPEDNVEFARRLGIDAVACPFQWQDDQIQELMQTGVDFPLPVTEQVSLLERYVRAAQKTGVGILVTFNSLYRYACGDVSSMQALHDLQQDVVQMIGDRFQQELVGFFISGLKETDSKPMVNDLIQQIHRYDLPVIVGAQMAELSVDALAGDEKTTASLPVIEALNQNSLDSPENVIHGIYDRHSMQAGRLINIDGSFNADHLNRLIRVIRKSGK